MTTAPEERSRLLDDEKLGSDCEDVEGLQCLADQRPCQTACQRFLLTLRSEAIMADLEERISNRLQSITWCNARGLFVAIFMPSMFKNVDGKTEQGRGTEWLDGLRGLAAWWVVNSHLASLLVKWSAAGYGSDDGSGTRHTEFFMLPFFRLVFSGQFSVYIFFVISGTALSLSPVARMSRKDGDPAAALKSISSSALRRPIRLFVPAIASMIWGFAFVRSGSIEWAFQIFQKSSVLDGWDSRWTQFPSAMDRSFGLQIVDLWRETLKLFDIIKPTQSVPAYNAVLWTIVIEYRASLMLYLMHLALFHLRRSYRICIAVLLLFVTIGLGYMYELLFIGGYIMAEVNTHQKEAARERSTYIRTALWTIVAIVALWLASMPGFMPQFTPLYSTLGSINPLGIDEAGHAWHRIAAMLLFVALSQEPILQRPLNTWLGQYAGKISFSLYLVHLPMVTVLGTYLFDEFLTRGGEQGMPSLLIFLAAYALMLLPILYVADRFEELVDRPSVRLGKALERIMSRRQVKV